MLERYNDAHPRQRIEPWSEEHYGLLEPFYRYLARLGQRAATTYIKEGAQGAPGMIRWIALDNGQRWRFDYTAFDRHVERLADWGIDAQINAFSPVGWNSSEIPFWDEAAGEMKVFDAPLGSQTYNALWNLFLTDFKSHLVGKGWFGKTVLYMDEVPQDEMEAAIGLIRYNDANWKIGLAYGHAPDDRVIRSLYDVSGYYESEIDVQYIRSPAHHVLHELYADTAEQLRRRECQSGRHGGDALVRHGQGARRIPALGLRPLDAP